MFTGILAIIVCGILILLNERITNKIARTAINLHTSWWTILILISVTDPVNLLPVSFDTYALIIIYIVGVNFGVLFVNLSYKNDTSQINNLQCSYSLSYYTGGLKMYVLVGSLVVLCGYLLYKFLGLLAQYTFAQAHSMRMGVEFFESPVLMLLYNNIVLPLCYFMMFLCSTLILKRKFNLFFFLALLTIIETFLIGFGKGLILIMLFQFSILTLFAIKFNFKQLIGSIPSKKELFNSFFKVAICLILLTLIFSSLRESDSESFLDNVKESVVSFNEQVMSYLIGPFRMLDYAIHNHNFLLDLGFCTFGKSTLLGPDKLLYWIVTPLGIPYVSNYEEILGGMQDALVIVTKGGSNGMNYAFSSILFFYLDFGLFGVFIIPFFLGCILRYFVHIFSKKPNIPILALIVFFLAELMISFFNWELAKPGLFLYCLVLWFCGRKKNFKIKGNYNHVEILT